MVPNIKIIISFSFREFEWRVVDHDGNGVDAIQYILQRRLRTYSIVYKLIRQKELDMYHVD